MVSLQMTTMFANRKLRSREKMCQAVCGLRHHMRYAGSNGLWRVWHFGSITALCPLSTHNGREQRTGTDWTAKRAVRRPRACIAFRVVHAPSVSKLSHRKAWSAIDCAWVHVQNPAKRRKRKHPDLFGPEHHCRSAAGKVHGGDGGPKQR